MKELMGSLLRRCGFELVHYRLIEGKPPRLRDLSDADMRILEKITSALGRGGLVDEYPAGLAKKYFLRRIDYTCRSFTK